MRGKGERRMSTETLERSGTAGAARAPENRKVSFRMMTTIDDLPAQLRQLGASFPVFLSGGVRKVNVLAAFGKAFR